METLLKEAYAYRRVTARTESERNKHKSRFVNGLDMHINAIAIHAVGSVCVKWPHVGTIAYSQTLAFIGEFALVRNSAQARTSNALRSDSHRVSSTISPRKTVLQRLGSTSDDLTDSEVGIRTAKLFFYASTPRYWQADHVCIFQAQARVFPATQHTLFAGGVIHEVNEDMMRSPMVNLRP